MAGQPRYATPEVVEYVVELLARRWRKGQVKRAIRDLCARAGAKGEPSRETVETILRRARAEMAARTLRSQDEHRADAVSFYETILRDPNANVRERLLAQEGLNHVLGLHFAPRPAPPDERDAEEDAARLRDAVAAMRASVPDAAP